MKIHRRLGRAQRAARLYRYQGSALQLRSDVAGKSLPGKYVSTLAHSRLGLLLPRSAVQAEYEPGTDRLTKGV